MNERLFVGEYTRTAMATSAKLAIGSNKNVTTSGHVAPRPQTFGMNGIGAPSPAKKIVIRSIHADDNDDGDFPPKISFTSTPTHMHTQPQDTSYMEVNTPGQSKRLQPQDMSYTEVMGNKALFQSHASSTPIQTRPTHQQWKCEHGCGFEGNYDLVVWHESICISTTRAANDPRCSPYSQQPQMSLTSSSSALSSSPNPSPPIAVQPSTLHSSSDGGDSLIQPTADMNAIALNEYLVNHRGLYPGETYVSSLVTDSHTSTSTWATTPLPINKLAMCELVRDTKDHGSKKSPVYMLRLQGDWDAESQSFQGNGEVMFFAKRCVDRKRVSSYLIDPTFEELILNETRHMAKLKGNFNSDNFKLFDDGCKPSQTEGDTRLRCELANIKFLSHKLLYSGPRQILATIPQLEPSTYPPTTAVQTLINKTPDWDAVNKTYSLKFFGRSRMPSVKNFVLIRDGSRYVGSPSTLRHGKMTENTFTVDFRFPLTPLQAFGIALSSYDTSVRENINLF
eukprot:m.147680 g.147680  ORF g.147680 m.147680 type:complete len:508 (-) comp30553_c0_seq2:74-1597(-)